MILHRRSEGLIVFLLLSVASLFGLANDVQAQPAANVVFATGSARIIAADGATRPAARGAVLEVGDMIDTQDGKAQLRFRDGAAISLQPGSQFRVEQYRFVEQDGWASENDTVVMRFFKGALRAISGLIGRQKREQYRMDTPVGTIGIRGTEYGAEMGGDGLSVTTYKGLVEVCNSAGCASVAPGQTVVVPGENIQPRAQGDSGAPSMPEGASMPQLPPVQQTTVPMAPAVQQETQMPPTASPGYGGKTY